jgi:hypothetical protein
VDNNTPKSTATDKSDALKAFLEELTVNAFIAATITASSYTLASLTAKDPGKSNSFYEIDSLYGYTIIRCKGVG